MEKNVAVRVFKEQFDLIQNLPEEDRPKVLYAVIWNAFNQFDNQNENQFDNQNENQTANQVILSLSLYLNQISVSLSSLGNSILCMLKKTIIAKEFSPNYGGNRHGAGRPKKDDKNEKEKEIQKKTEDMIKDLANNLSEKNHAEIAGKTVHVAQGEFYLDNTMPDYKSLLCGLSDAEIEKLRNWIMQRYAGKHLPVSKIQLMIKNFNKNLYKGVMK